MKCKIKLQLGYKFTRQQIEKQEKLVGNICNIVFCARRMRNALEIQKNWSIDLKFD